MSFNRPNPEHVEKTLKAMEQKKEVGMHIFISEDLHERVKIRCAKERISLKALGTLALEEYLAK